MNVTRHVCMSVLVKCQHEGGILTANAHVQSSNFNTLRLRILAIQLSSQISCSSGGGKGCVCVNNFTVNIIG